jgi:hypothetical protein
MVYAVGHAVLFNPEGGYIKAVNNIGGVKLKPYIFTNRKV